MKTISSLNNVILITNWILRYNYYNDILSVLRLFLYCNYIYTA